MCAYEIYLVDYGANGGVLVYKDIGNYLFVWEVFISKI